jgi:hypothetical protein
VKREAEDVARRLEEVEKPGLGREQIALKVFDFSQRLVETRRGPTHAGSRRIPECVASNRAPMDASAALAKRRPLDLPAERPIPKRGAPDCRERESSEAILSFIDAFLGPLPPHLQSLCEIMPTCT